ncbi:endosome-associated ubiquitin isopeptidase (AmsH), putative [Talaromyces stipitatus ATCC 10500]|uniref:Endosome-associated ubiquitin isopeptidase (AmsH), putative n=1 Tax=Talaromyces stipitatus (strain ATCC 10500 / CBS 375.48 / QM 6759 / NRRL 1006) TaxID=441959 RepID=B8MTD3_TALSN|nr:endosome-associated ubiquitin isopeptidase (AmsH), putative [Talaromyces stipitatus ATCC 10500]EED12382.1 endosome-associated ubiquitin isopeptidase (AmsH), putative [Talaromyces stipitatus ATCC 10500]
MIHSVDDMASNRVSSAPHNVEQITRLAQDYEYNPAIPLKLWLRTANSLVKEAEIYEREGHDEQAYLLLFRHAQLVLVNLVNHPDAELESNRQGLLAAEKQVRINIKKLESLKPLINKRYERYQQLLQNRESRRTQSSQSRHEPPTSRYQSFSNPALSGTAQPLEAGENRELAVQIAHREINRRENIKRARASGISQDEERTRRTGGMWGDWEQALGEQKPSHPADDLSRRIQEVRLRMEEPRYSQSRQNTEEETSSTYKYPTVPKHKPYDGRSHGVPKPAYGQLEPQEAPMPPPKEFRENTYSIEELPPRPSKFLSTGPPLPSKESTKPPADPSDLNPSTFTFKPSAYLENGTPLRTVFLPPNLRQEFLRLADSNTRRNLETCGILCGTLISNALFISKLLIPEQESTSDTCETVNESAIFDYCDSEDLMVLGWIHTHPTQTCFMSSRDLHTHCGYQAMLPESIAIVCAPTKDPDWGVFRLTDPPGLKSVLGCTQKGLFHPHAETNLYTDALRPGHVFEAKGLEFETVDLRPGI